MLGTRQDLLVIDLLNIGGHIKVLVRLVRDDKAAVIHIIRIVRLLKPMLLLPRLQGLINDTRLSCRQMVALNGYEVLLDRIKCT